MNDQPCNILKRLGAIFYDSLCLFSLFFLVTMILMFATDGAAITSDNIIYHLYLLLVAYLYFAWHWVNGGQTLGMRAWRIKLKPKFQRLSWRTVTIRFILAAFSFCLFGIGFFWSIFDREKLTFYDRYSKTHLVTTE